MEGKAALVAHAVGRVPLMLLLFKLLQGDMGK